MENKHLVKLTALLLVASACSLLSSKGDMIKENFQVAEIQYEGMLKELLEPTAYPRTLTPQGKLKTTPMNDWTEGFFPGSLWYIYEYTGSEKWKNEAIRWTLPLEPLQYLKWHHDIGFLMYCSFGNGYRLTGNDTYRNILIESANSLCTRFSPITRTIESWDYRKAWNGEEWFYPVIIDNMMNLELLYFASRITGDMRYAKIATQHAETTALHQFREDYSTYHVVDYDTITGKVLHQQTCQGFADNSTWARGQAWAVYGFTLTFRETQKPQFLDVACKAADWWLNHANLPSDGVPYWDFNAGQPGYNADWEWNPQAYTIMPRDASAAAIMASALLELSSYVPQSQKRYFDAAEKIIHSLSSPDYRATAGTNGNFILKHSVGSLPHKAEIDVPLVYADYYFLEALLRYKKIK